MTLDPRGGWHQVGDGSIWTTPTQLVSWSAQYWAQMLDGPDLVSVRFDPETDASEGDPQTDDRYGPACSDPHRVGAEVLFHTGSWGSYDTDWAVIPDEKLAAAVTCHLDAKMSTNAPAEALRALWRQ